MASGARADRQPLTLNSVVQPTKLAPAFALNSLNAGGIMASMYSQLEGHTMLFSSRTPQNYTFTRDTRIRPGWSQRLGLRVAQSLPTSLPELPLNVLSSRGSSLSSAPHYGRPRTNFRYMYYPASSFKKKHGSLNLVRVKIRLPHQLAYKVVGEGRYLPFSYSVRPLFTLWRFLL